MAAIARAHNLVDRAMRATLEARAILANLLRGADRPRENRSAEAAGEGGES